MIKAFPRILKVCKVVPLMSRALGYEISNQPNVQNKRRRYPDFDPATHVRDFPRDTPFTQIPEKFPYTEDMNGLPLPEIKTRMLYVLSKYDKIALTEQFDWKGHFDKDHGLDSLDIIAIITSFEEEFHTVFEDSAFDNFKSFEDVAEFVATLHDAY